MERYDEGYVREVEREVDELRAAALALVQKTHPEIECVIDQRSIYDYSERFWDYPGQWYLCFKLPHGFQRKQEVILAIAEDTIRYYTKKTGAPS